MKDDKITEFIKSLGLQPENFDARPDDLLNDQISTEDNPKPELESKKKIPHGPFEVEGREITWNDI